MKARFVLSLVAATSLAAAAAAQGQTPPAPPKPAAAHAQTPPPAVQSPPAQKPATPVQTPPPAAPRPATRAPQSARLLMAVTVTDTTGAPLGDVRVEANGPVIREGVTVKDGTVRLQGLRAGAYRVRFSADGYVMLEKEVTLKSGPEQVDATLIKAPTQPKPAEPPPAPPPALEPAPELPPPDPNATIQVLMLPDWIDKNFIGRNDPQKDTPVGRTPAAAATVLQVRDPIKERMHTDADEMLYVIAGQGVLRSKGREQALDAGALAVIPRGASYGIERRGRNPLIALSILSR